VSALLALAVALMALGGPGATVAQERDGAFKGRVEHINRETRERMTGVSWHPGCPVGFADLRLLTVDSWGFDGRSHRGRLVVHRDQAQAILGTMRKLYRLRFPIRRMRLVDAYGRAIDVNPVENPYVTDSGYVSPPAGAPFVDRSRRAKGLIHPNGPVVAAFAGAGWEWAGNWPWPKDYQHFSATGG
jgi:murein DD-endopeptidase MepM/ murein hydrolase activator NlpD